MNPIKSLRPRVWWIQKPTAHNCPLRSVGAVFQEFKPTVAEQGCEWVGVHDSAYVELLERIVEIQGMALKKMKTITITDGCSECSSVWTNDYESKVVREALTSVQQMCEEFKGG